MKENRGTPTKTKRNAWIVNEVLVRGRKQVAVLRQWNGLAKPAERITRQRLHAIVARARKRLQAEAERKENDGEAA